MKKKRTILFFSLALMIVGITVVAAQTLFQICINISSGSGTSYGGYSASYNYAGVEITPNQFYSTSNPKKTRMKVFRKNNSGSYVLKTTTTFSLYYGCITKGLGKPTSGTWKLGIYQYDANDNPYVGVDADLSFFSSSTSFA